MRRAERLPVGLIVSLLTVLICMTTGAAYAEIVEMTDGEMAAVIGGAPVGPPDCHLCDAGGVTVATCGIGDCCAMLAGDPLPPPEAGSCYYTGRVRDECYGVGAFANTGTYTGACKVSGPTNCTVANSCAVFVTGTISYTNCRQS